MPAHPTWQQVADLAAKADGAQPGMKGICLRGQPGWGQVLAPLTTVVNTFGGTWFDKDWNGPGRRARVQEGHQLLRRIWCASTARSVRRSPASPSASPISSRARSRCGTTPRRPPARSRPRARPSPARSATSRHRSSRRRRRAGSTRGRGPSRRPAITVEGLEVRLVGIEQGLRETRRQQARLGQRPGRQARLDLHQPRLPQDRERVRQADAHRDPDRRTRRSPGVQPRPTGRHPVRRHPRVHRLRHQGLPVDQFGDRRQGVGRQRALGRARTSRPPSARPTRSERSDADDERTARCGASVGRTTTVRRDPPRRPSARSQRGSAGCGARRCCPAWSS